MSAVEQPRPAEMFELPPGLCRALLSTQVIGRLVLPGTEPYIVPVNFALVDDGIVFRSEPGPRVEALEGHHVAFEVDDHDVRTQSGWSVVVRGAAHEITLDVAERASAGRSSAVRPWAPGDKPCWIRIQIESVSGRLLRGAVLPTWVNQQAYL